MAKNLLLPVTAADPAAAAQKTVAGGASAPATAKAYYAMPEIGKDTDALYNAAKAAEQAAKESQDAYAKGYAILKEKQEALAKWSGLLQMAQQKFEATGSASDAATLAKYRNGVLSLQTQATEAKRNADQAGKNYTERMNAYSYAADAYNKYIAEQNRQYDAWKSTVRSDTSAVQAELDAVNKQLSQLQGKDTLGKVSHFLGQAGTAAMGGTPVYTPYAADPQLEELTRRKALLEEELEYSRHFGYEALAQEADFATSAKAGLDRFSADKAAAMAQKNGKSTWEKILEANANNYLMSTENPIVTQMQLQAKRYQEDTSYMEPSDKWSQQQKDTFGYLYSRSPAEAAQYAQRLNEQIAVKERNASIEKVKQEATKDGWSAVGHTLGALATAPSGLADLLDNLAEHMGRGTITTKGGEILTPFDYSQAVVGGISGKLNEIGTIDKDVPVLGGKGLGDLYQLGFSMAQSMLAGKVAGLAGNGASTLIQFFGQAGAAGVDEALERGGNASQALLYGLVCGVAEAGAENVGIEKMLNIKAASGLKGWLKNMFKQGIAEGGEEVLTSVINTVADGIIMADKSAFNKSVQEYMKTMSKEDAEKQAFWDILNGIVYDGLSGFASGTGHGMIMTGVQSVKANNALKKLGWDKLTMEDVQEIVASGMESAQDTEAYELALELQKQLDAGKMPSKTDIVQQIQANDRAIWAEEKAAESQAVGNAEVQEENPQQLVQNQDSAEGIREQLRKSQDRLNALPSVADIKTPTEFAQMDLEEKKNWVIEKLRPTGYVVERKGLGLISFAKKKLRAAFNYFDKGSVEEAAFEAIPYVLQKGVVISSRENHKGRKYSTITIAAPVTINGRRGNMAVVVRQTEGNQYKVHRILSPDGSAFVIAETENEAGSSTTRGVTDNGSLASSKDTASNFIIDQGSAVVKNNDQNGGNENGEHAGEGDRVLAGGSQRDAGVGAGEPGRGMAQRAGADQSRRSAGNSGRAIVERRNLAQDLRRQGLILPVSSKELGLKNGTDTKNISVLPREHWDAELQTVAQKILEETGKEVTFIVGKMQLRFGEIVSEARGARTRENIIVQVDNPAATATQIGDHEMFHDMIRERLWLLRDVQQQVLENHTDAELAEIVSRYAEALSATMTINDKTDMDKLAWRIEEEIYADAYAGINYKGAGATQFTEPVRQYAQQATQRRAQRQANGVRQTNGPNAAQENTVEDDGVRYSLEDGSIKDASELSRNDLRYLLECAQYGVLSDSSYIPLRRNTPEFFIRVVREHSKGAVIVNNYPMAATVEHLRQNMDEEDGQSYGEARPHGFSMDDIITISEKMGDPSYIVLQKNGRYAEVVSFYNKRNKQVVVAIDFADSGSAPPKNYKHTQYMNGYGGGYYNVIVTQYEPDSLAKYLRDNEVVYDKKEMNGRYQVGSGRIVTITHDTPFIEDIVAEDDGGVKRKDAAYLDAVNRGDMETAQRMVDEAAKNAGYDVGYIVYRGDDAPWNVLHKGSELYYYDDFEPAGNLGDGLYFTPSIEYAKRFAGEDGVLRKFYLKTDAADLSDPDVDALLNAIGEEIAYEDDGFIPQDRLYKKLLERLGKDGIKAKGVGQVSYGAEEIAVQESWQAKLADPVTYDDDGNVIPLSQRFNEESDDIRYSMDEGEVSQIDAEMDAQLKQWKEQYLQNRLGVEGAKEYHTQKAQQEAQRKAEQKLKDKEKRKVDANRRKLQKEYRDSKADAAMNSKLREGAKPTQAKKELRVALLDMFSIPAGNRAEIAELIDSMADRMLREGALTENLRKAFFDRMYASGVMTVPADEYMAMGRDAVNKGKVYVDAHVRAEFGDDWNEMRRRAFAAGVYLTNDRADAGLDQWNHELAELLPGLFDSEETDPRSILERIVDVAEEGRSEKVSLPEYTAQLAGEHHVSVDEVLDNLERNMDTALRIFAKTAGMEIQLKEQSIRQQAALTKENMRQRLQLAQERQERKEMAQREQEQKELREMQQKTLKALQWLNQNRWRAPEELQGAFDEVLSDIDIYAVGAANEMRWSDKYGATWKDLAQMYQTAKETDSNFMPSKELEMIVSRLNDQKIADLDMDALNDLYKAAVGLRTEFYNRNNVISDELHRMFEEVYSDSKGELTAAAGGYTGKMLDRLFNMEQLTAMNVMQRMAGWNPDSAWYSMAKQLERGERDVRAFTVKANRMLEEFLTEHADWVKKADGQGKDAVWYTLEVPELLELRHGDKPIFGDTVTVHMTPAQKIHMYLESKNVQNLRHMMGGRTFANKELYGEGKRQEAFAQGKTIRLAPETVKQIVSDLTAEEMELAQILEKFYNEFAKGEINRVSNVLYGYDKAMGKHYAPIFTNQNYVQSEIGKFDQTAEGVGNMKGRIPYSKNPSYNIGAFDAFERNVDQTARFVGMSIPARNWQTLLNWQEDKGSMGEVITHQWGEESKKYIENLLVDLQGGKAEKKDVVSESTEKLMSNYISSVFGANPSIVLKQLGSIPLAGVYLGGGNVPTPMQVAHIDRALIRKYTQDLDWRSMGYSMPETKQLKDNPNWTQTNKVVKFTFGGGAITAMDTWAASTLWPWAENKVRKEHPELEMGSREQIEAGQSPFYKKVAEEFENALARSQSTSDQMHQGTLRKSHSPLARMFTMFRSDSAQTYNALRQMIGEAQYIKANGGDKAEVQKATRAVGTVFLAALSNFMLAEGINLAMAMIKNKGKAYRDDEDELTVESILSQVGVNLLKGFAGIFAGGEELADMIGAVLLDEKWYEVESMEVSLIQDLMSLGFGALEGVRDLIAEGVNVAINGGDLLEYFRRHGNDMLGSIKDAAADVAGFFGIPASNVEAYLIGLVKKIPGFDAAYEDVFATATKSGLSGLSGKDLQVRIGNVLDIRGVEAADDTQKALADLYAEGYTSAVPSNTPGTVSVDGEEHKLSAYQQQVYDKAWAEIVNAKLDGVVSSEVFREADSEKQEKMLKTLYSYAADEAKAELFEELEGSSRADDIAAFEEAGLDMADYLGVVADGHKPGKFLEAIENGLSAEQADDLMDEIAELEPEEGAEQVADVQRWRLCVDMFDNPASQLAALATHMSDSQIKKATAANSMDVSLDTYVKLYEIRAEHDANGNKSYSQAEYKSAIDSMRLSRTESAVLWQLATGAKSAKNNPYSTSVGQKVLDALE